MLRQLFILVFVFGHGLAWGQIKTSLKFHGNDILYKKRFNQSFQKMRTLYQKGRSFKEKCNNLPRHECKLYKRRLKATNKSLRAKSDSLRLSLLQGTYKSEYYEHDIPVSNSYQKSLYQFGKENWDIGLSDQILPDGDNILNDINNDLTNQTSQFENPLKALDFNKKLRYQEYLGEQIIKNAHAIMPEEIMISQQFTEVSKKISKLKKKYSIVPSGKDLSKAIKRNSLAGQHFSERLQLDGLLSLNISRDIQAEFESGLSYSIRKNIRFGIGSGFRMQVLTPFRKFQPVVMPNWKLNVYGEIDLKKGLLLHTRGDARKINIKETTEPNWKYHFLAGVGKKFKVNRKVTGRFLVLYNFNSVHQPFRNRLEFHYGYSTSICKLFKKR